jgi:HEAT repeat protein
MNILSLHRIILACASLSLSAGPADVQAQIAVLQRPGADLHDKARACQKLGEIGAKEAVPALSALLFDTNLSAYARSGLEGIPDPSAAAALRAALPKLKGNLLIGVIHSLGVLRDSKSVAALTRLTSDANAEVAGAALRSMGRISNTESIPVIRKALGNAPEAAPACLIAAEFQLAAGNAPAAVSLYDAVRTAQVPEPYRLAALRGAIVARKADGIQLLVQMLKSDERAIRNVALLTAREIPSDRLAQALQAELASAKPELQAQLIEALAGYPNPQSIQAVRARLTDANPLVRRAALQAMGKLGGPADAPALLNAVVESRNADESTAAAASLARIEGADVDTLIINKLTAAASPASRIALIDLLDARSPASATAELLKQAATTDPQVSLAAFRALRSLVGRDHLPALIALAKSCQDGPRRAAAETALFYACTRKSADAEAGEILLAELRKPAPDLDKASWIRTLSLMGYQPALPAIVPSLRDANPWLANISISSLNNWPGPVPIDALLDFTRTATDAAQRTRALAAALQLATTAGNGRQAPPATVAAWFQQAIDLSRSLDNIELVLSHLGRWTHPESIRLLAPFLDRPEVKTQAASAILGAAGPVAEGPACAILKPLLDRIATMGNQGFTDRVANLRRAIQATEARLPAQQVKP